MKKYNVGVYVRLSLKDRDTNKVESNSIEVQKNLIKNFIEKEDCLKVSDVKIYCDDGYSGVSFERPQMQLLLDDVKSGRINCVIVKDLSRFGRNYIEVGNYLERIFPFLKVRFIAIEDNYDSDSQDRDGDLVAAFKSLFADIYSKELSVKVRAAQEKYAKQGKYAGGSIPYGYIQSKTDKHKIVVDEEAADIVKYIFDEFIAGKNMTEIAKDLNAQEIPTKAVYSIKNGKKFAQIDGKVAVWTNDSVDTVLNNQLYTGDYVYFASSRIGVGNRKVKKNAEKDRIVCENSHQAIISKEVFEAVKMRRTSCESRKQGKKDVLATLMNCGVCNHRLQYVKIKTAPYFKCPISIYSTKLSCCNTRISRSRIETIIIESIQKLAEIAVERKKMIMPSPLKKELVDLKKQRTTQNAKYKRLNERYKVMFQNMVDEKISIETFDEEVEIISKNKKETSEHIESLDKEIEELELNIKQNDEFIDFFKEYIEVKELSDKMLKLLVKTIIIYSNNDVEIEWNFNETNI